MNLLLWAIMFLSFLVFSYEKGIYYIPQSKYVTDYPLEDLDNGLKGHWTGLFANLSNDYNYGLYFLENEDAGYRLSMVVYDNTIDDGYFGQETWTANASRAISDKGFLSISTDGNLVLYDDGTEVWSTQTKGYDVQWLSISNQGNLILGNHKSGKIWQSFDNPTDTMVCTQVLRQGMKLFKGSYSLQVQENMVAALYGDQIYKKWVYNASSGNYLVFCCNDTRLSLQIRSDLDKVTQFNFLHSKYCQVGADNITEIMGVEIYNAFTYATFVRLNSMGQLTATKWEASKRGFEDCDLPTVCGSYGLCNNGSCSCTYSSDFTYADQSNHAAGCKEQEPQVLYTSSCSNSSLTKPIAGIDYYANQYINPEVNVTSLQDCKDACLRNKSCQTGFFITKSCFLYSQVSSLKKTNNSSHYVFFRMCQNISSTPSVHSKSSQLKVVVISISVVLGFFLALAALIACWLKKNMQNSDFEEEDSILESYISEAALKRFSYKELEEITGEFKEELGKGGFGTVYKGRLPNGDFVAVKKLDGLTQNPKEFYAEVSILSKVHHFNLVQLVGFCAERRKRALVYEYMMNGSLDQWIFGTKSADLNWQTRLNIAMGAAKGMAYLHEECSERIVHLDVKPQNILLDHNFEAKVADFGLSRFIDRGQSFVMTMVRGTRGYLAPEWFTQGAINVKADVFSFGVVLLEIIGWNTQNILQESGTMFRLSETNFLRSLLVENFGDSFDLEEAKRLVEVACLCVQHEVDDRLNMSMVVQMLEGKAPIPEIKTNHGFPGNISTQTRENFMKLLESKSSFVAGSSTVDLESNIDPR